MQQGEKLPYEPSFGWVGRTNFGGEHQNINERNGGIVPTYDPYQNYNEIQQRNEFDIEYDIKKLYHILSQSFNEKYISRLEYSPLDKEVWEVSGYAD